MGKDATDSTGAGFGNGRVGRRRDRADPSRIVRAASLRRSLRPRADAGGEFARDGAEPRVGSIACQSGNSRGRLGIEPAPHRGWVSASLLRLFFSDKALAAAMTVAHNEYEHGENDLRQVPHERLRSVVLDWRNYQSSPVGNRSDARTSRSITCARQ